MGTKRCRISLVIRGTFNFIPLPLKKIAQKDVRLVGMLLRVLTVMLLGATMMSPTQTKLKS